jgi:hypothetical protein
LTWTAHGTSHASSIQEWHCYDWQPRTSDGQQDEDTHGLFNSFIRSFYLWATQAVVCILMIPASHKPLPNRMKAGLQRS